MAMLHMRVEGQSRDVDLEALNLRSDSTDEDIHRALAAYLDKEVTFFRQFAIVRDNGNVTVRPQAVFGV